jgi:hypothetical protein
MKDMTFVGNMVVFCCYLELLHENTHSGICLVKTVANYRTRSATIQTWRLRWEVNNSTVLLLLSNFTCCSPVYGTGHTANASNHDAFP